MWHGTGEHRAREMWTMVHPWQRIRWRRGCGAELPLGPGGVQIGPGRGADGSEGGL